MHASQIAFVLYLAGAVLAIVAALVPEASGRLLPLAVACGLLGAAVQVSP